MHGRTVTYGPGAIFYGGILLWLGLAVGLVVAAGDGAPLMISAKWWLCVIVALLLPFLAVRYRLDDEGIEVSSLLRRKRWPWGQLRDVQGTSVSGDGPYTESISSVVRHEVRGGDGRRLFRISPWTGNRRELVSEIRQRIRAADPTRTEPAAARR